MCNCTSWMRRLAQARNPHSRSWLWIPGSLVSLARRNDVRENQSRAVCAAFSFQSSKIRGDALVLPIAVSCRFRAFRALKFLGRGLGVCFRGFSPCFGLGERAFGRRRQRLSFAVPCGPFGQLG